jgi:hypothetical protein
MRLPPRALAPLSAVTRSDRPKSPLHEWEGEADIAEVLLREVSPCDIVSRERDHAHARLGRTTGTEEAA